MGSKVCHKRHSLLFFPQFNVHKRVHTRRRAELLDDAEFGDLPNVSVVDVRRQILEKGLISSKEFFKKPKMIEMDE